MNKHAQIKVGGYTIPLIGIKPEETLEICSLCGNFVSIQEVEINAAGNQFLCPKCRKNEEKENN